MSRILKRRGLKVVKFTSAAYRNRTSLPCAVLSFRDIAEGALPNEMTILTSPPATRPVDFEENPIRIEMVICSFALHLIETAYELFALLWELSTKAKWLVLLAPHKKPEVCL